MSGRAGAGGAVTPPSEFSPPPPILFLFLSMWALASLFSVPVLLSQPVSRALPPHRLLPWGLSDSCHARVDILCHFCLAIVPSPAPNPLGSKIGAKEGPNCLPFLSRGKDPAGDGESVAKGAQVWMTLAVGGEGGQPRVISQRLEVMLGGYGSDVQQLSSEAHPEGLGLTTNPLGHKGFSATMMTHCDFRTPPPWDYRYHVPGDQRREEKPEGAVLALGSL